LEQYLDKQIVKATFIVLGWLFKVYHIVYGKKCII